MNRCSYPTILASAALVVALGLVACAPRVDTVDTQPEAPRAEQASEGSHGGAMPPAADTPSAPSIHITPRVISTSGGGWQLRVGVRNDRQAAIHLLTTPRAPYRTVDEGELVLRWSLRAPPAGLASGWLEEPGSRIVEPGAEVTLEAQVAWPVTLEDHYLRARPHVGELSLPLSARVEIAYLSEALTPERATDLSLQGLLAEQGIVTSTSFTLSGGAP